MYWNGLLAIRQSVEQSAAPAAASVAGQASFGDGHGEEPPALLRAERSPFAADDWNLIFGSGLRSPGKHAQLLAEKAIYEVFTGVPAAGGCLGGLQAVIEVAASCFGYARPDLSGDECPFLGLRRAADLAVIAVI